VVPFQIHDLKTEAPYFQAVFDGIKTFEIRKNDRNFNLYDYLRLIEIENGKPTGRSCLKSITYILDDARFLPPGFVCMSIQ
jgi:ParB family chromosome partitioning protein